MADVDLRKSSPRDWLNWLHRAMRCPESTWQESEFLSQLRWLYYTRENHVGIFAKILATKEATRSQSRSNFEYPLFTPSEVLRSAGLQFFFHLQRRREGFADQDSRPLCATAPTIKANFFKT
ncbi:hypothetical protein PGT21_006635 [Puccinia graminis f. sp. tritici]|uniref:Uncharacterized protein n=1 Tax=Puccinia graminis f. sp. tritici TaxID=56615 RepID=A0A5B0QA71_PUCGR|nr:hypothetical protein PGT21_006635 [Puccinia graminis f. sp. tritici]